jgi:hypothetical protein
VLFHVQLLLPLSQGIANPSIVDAVMLMFSIGKQGSFGRSGLQRESIVPGLAIRPEVVIVEFPSSLTKPGMCHSRLNQPYQSEAGSFFTHCPSIKVPLIRALIDSKQSSWISVSHGPTQEKDPFAGTTGDHALTGVAVVVATSEDASRENPRRKRLCDIIKGYRNWRALGNGFVEYGKRIPVLV